MLRNLPSPYLNLLMILEPKLILTIFSSLIESLRFESFDGHRPLPRPQFQSHVRRPISLRLVCRRPPLRDPKNNRRNDPCISN